MKRRLRNIILSTVVVIVAITAVSYERSFFDELSNKNISRQAQRYITTKSIQIENEIEHIADQLASGDGLELWINNKSSDDFIIFVTTRNHVEYWNSNRISPENIPFSSKLMCKQIDNAWFLYKSYQLYHYRIDVLINIKNNYAISNEYFQNNDAYQSELSQYSLSDVPQIGYNPVYGEDGSPLFYFAKTELNEHNQRTSLFSSALFLLLFFFILLLLSRWHRNSSINLLSLIVLGLGILALIYYSNIIPVFNKTNLFTNTISIGRNTTSSLGMLSLYGILWIVTTYNVSKYILNKSVTVLQAIGICLLSVITFHYILSIYLNILHNTPFSFQLYRIRYLSLETFWTYGILILFFSGWGRLVYVAVRSFRRHKFSYFYPFIALLLCYPFLHKNPIPVSFCTFFMLIIVFSHRRRKQMLNYSFINLLIAGILIALMMTLITEHESNKKNDEGQQALIQTLPTSLLYERDYFIEENLVDIWNEMQDDGTLKNLPTMFLNSVEDYYTKRDFYTNYLKKKYFSGQLQEYDMQVVICNKNTELQVDETFMNPNCYNFFSNLLYDKSEVIKNTGFYWRKNNNGRVSYMCWFKTSENTAFETSLFIEFESPILSEGQGYPEMLREQSDATNTIPEESSFARYFDGKLITSSGRFRYPPSDKWIPTSNSRLFKVDFDRYSHVCYRIMDDTFVILSRQKPSVLYPVYAYIYNFLLFYLSFLIIHLFSKKHKIKYNHTISNSIRLTIFAILFLSLILIGTASVVFPLNVYKHNQEIAINDKGESILNGISNDLAGISNIHNVPKAVLINTLQSLSNTLSTDVNIYDLDGKFYASSRPQLFDYKLQGNMINPRAYKAFKYQNLTSQIHNETIGNNVYTSAYYVISNGSEEPIAYVNVPFFSSQKNLKRSLYDFVVLLLNLYLLLVFVVILVTFFSINAITKPLLFIQNGLSKMRLGSNEKIQYNRNDEIGSLVEKYNVMVDELNASVQQLAKNEREFAWQRMARQIAHEIKNPLTPMKLSIQHLARTKVANPEAFDDYFKKTANTLIDQIDNLSSIATSFSSFAKITDGTPEVLQVNERLTNVVTLFGQSGSNVEFESNVEDFAVFMDKDHFIQVLNNLIKNALQSIPEERDGRISVWTKNDNANIYIYVKDNGKGIDDETKDKIFQPNFTTKNSGMGLGLAISKKMINNAGGDITFTSIIDEGTTFEIRLPLYNETV